MRIVAWNIRAGGGRRAEGIVRQLHQWNPDLAILSEFRGTAASQGIAAALAEQGLSHQRATCSAESLARNALLVASRWPLRRKRSAREPAEPERWLRVGVLAPQRFDVLAVHAPNRVTNRKYPFLDAIGDVVESWSGPPAMVIGDTNTGRIGIDEESSAFNAREEQWMLHIRLARRISHPASQCARIHLVFAQW